MIILNFKYSSGKWLQARQLRLTAPVEEPNHRNEMVSASNSGALLFPTKEFVICRRVIACFFTKSILHKSVFRIKEIEPFIKHVGKGGITTARK